MPRLPTVGAVFGRSRRGIDFQSPDGDLTRLFFMVVTPDGTPESSATHLKVLARISRLLREEEVRDRLLTAPDFNAIHQIICNQDAKYS
jgi:PTS system nitrogen regulatory IIA component